MNAVIMSFDLNEKQSVPNLREKAMKRVRAVESYSVKSARKAKDKLLKAYERVSEIRDKTMRMASMRVTRQSTHKYNHMHCCAGGLALQRLGNRIN